MTENQKKWCDRKCRMLEELILTRDKDQEQDLEAIAHVIRMIHRQSKFNDEVLDELRKVAEKYGI